MGLYQWIQEKIFDTYETWRLKSSLFNSSGFHIVGIDNDIAAMRDGNNMYLELYPPQAIEGCTCMKVTRGRAHGTVNFSLTIDGKTYGIPDLRDEEAAAIMRAFVQHRVLPPKERYQEMHATSGAEQKAAFTALAEMLLGAERAEAFCRRVELPAHTEKSDAWNDAWYELSEEMISCGRAVVLATRTAKEDFVAALEELVAGRALSLPASLHAEYGVPAWCEEVNAQWTDTLLAGMDNGTDDYVLLILSMEEFRRAQEYAETLLQRIARAEEM